MTRLTSSNISLVRIYDTLSSPSMRLMICLMIAIALITPFSQSHPTTCPTSRLTCINGGFIREDDCQPILSTCTKAEFGLTTKCSCPPGFYGSQCQFGSRMCPPGTVYSDQALSGVGTQFAECQLEYAKTLDNILFRLRDHLVHVSIDVAAKTVEFSLLTRSIRSGRCGHSIKLLTLLGQECEISKPTSESATRILTCSKKTIVTCNKVPEDINGCPAIVGKLNIDFWQSTLGHLKFTFEPDGPGKFKLSLPLAGVPLLGSLHLRGSCKAGSCIKPYLEINRVNMDNVKLHQIEPETSFIALAISCVTISLTMALCLVGAVVYVISETSTFSPKISIAIKNTCSRSKESVSPLLQELEPFRGIFWHSLSYRLQNIYLARRHSVILHPSSGLISGAQLVALIGRSGCGKSTFLDLLSGVYKPGIIAGRIGLIGAETTLGYVTQNDTLLPSLTVWETVSFAAKTRISFFTSYDDLYSHIANVLFEFGLISLAGSVVSGLSGGEKRRLTLATSLVLQNDVLLLDEPTTGLDSVNALSIVRILRKRALTHSTLVIMTIHQPSPDLLPLFDRVLLMGNCGRMIFNGTPDAAIQFISRHTSMAPVSGENPFEFMLEALDDGLNMDRMHREFEEDQETVLSMISAMTLVCRKAPSRCSPFWAQVRRLCKRHFRNCARSSNHLLLYYAVTVVVALALGGAFFKLDNRFSSGGVSRFGLFSCSCLFISLISLSSMDLFFSERIIQRRECPSAYSCGAFWVAKLMTDVIPFRLLPALIFALITYIMAGLQPTLFKFLTFTLIIILTSMAAGASTLLISLMTNNQRHANLIAFIYYLLNLFFGSTLISRNNPRTFGAFRYCCFFSFAIEAMSSCEFNGLHVIFDSAILKGDSLPIDGEQFLLQSGIDPSNMLLTLLGLVLFIMTLYGLGFIAVYLDPYGQRRHAAWIKPAKRRFKSN
uniref:ABC transporter domain-containing protein n=1 Tax=Spongospora subterranea TaxID=70186 RepID=A0A0H5RBP4_9EUKA|eukprot:CRZ11645.1 hypothetical protein [Spongospora subterranea]